jgi:lactate dehydrogenase-like 2-hydroxyacid dehydrogenase
LSSNLLDIFLLSLLAMFYPTLLAAVTVMLMLPNPKWLMLGYLLGAYTTSITLGLLIVFSLHGSSANSTAEHTISPLMDIVVGLIALVIAFALATGRDQPIHERRRKRKDAKLKAKEVAGKPTETLALRMLGRGSPRVTFAVGVILSFPGVSYLVALNHIAELESGTLPTVLLVVGFCLMQLMLLELPLLGYAFEPEWTKDAVFRFRAWLGRSGRRAGVIGAGAIGVILVGRGLVTLLS